MRRFARKLFFGPSKLSASPTCCVPWKSCCVVFRFAPAVGALAIAAPHAAIAQTSKIYRLGTLTVGPPMVVSTGRRNTLS
ncbi:MAG: hypothetical protein WAK33_00935 [Silvibacterium sp.]